jgi:hypothetical protein
MVNEVQHRFLGILTLEIAWIMKGYNKAGTLAHIV